MKRKQNASKYVRLIITALLIGLILFIVSLGICIMLELHDMNLYFHDWESELPSSKECVHITYSQYIHLDSGVLDLEGMTGLTDRDIFCIRNDRLFFGFVSQAGNDPRTENMGIASVKLDGSDLKIHYEEELLLNHDGILDRWNQLAYLSDRDGKTGSLYTNGYIYLRGSDRIVAYSVDDHTTEIVKELPASPYAWEINHDAREVLIQEVSTGISKTITIESMAQQNAYMKKLLKFSDRRVFGTNWHQLDDFFSDIKMVDDDIYIVGKVWNRGGAAIAVIFRYDFDTEQVEYAGSMTGLDYVKTEYDFLIKDSMDEAAP